MHRLYSLFCLHFIPERNKHHSRANFFELKRQPKDTAADIWTKLLEIEKNCEFEQITAAELIISKFISMIGKSTGDNELKKKIKKGEMTIDHVTELIHEHMYEKLNESSDSDQEEKIKHISSRKRRNEHFKPTEKKQKKTKQLQKLRKRKLDTPTRMYSQKRKMP